MQASAENTKTKEWWESEGGFFGDLYRQADNSQEGHLNSPQDLLARTEKEVNGVIKLCTLNPGGAVMDCPCGYGRHSLALAQKGFQVTGVDINKTFLKHDREELEKAKLANCQFVEKDMRQVDFNNQFNAVINMFYSFGFFETEEENLKVAANFYNALKPGGRFLMHTHITLPKILNGDYKTHEIRTLRDGKKLELFRTYNTQTKREDGEWFILHEDGKKDSLTPYSVRIYSLEEYTDLCKKAGFKEVLAYGDWSGTPYTDKSPELIAVAVK